MAVLTPLDQWFAAEILPLEGALLRYLGRVWPNSAEVPDLRQDVYVRVYESARRGFPNSPRAYLFKTARNLMADRVRRARIVHIDSNQDFEVLNALVDDISPERRLAARQELQVLAQAFDALSDKCRSVVWLRRVEGLSQQETARRLGMREGAVESRLARAVRVLASAVFGSFNQVEVAQGKGRARHEAEQG
jgi:RNA polymerase sigma factor (sigma-70 family)